MFYKHDLLDSIARRGTLLLLTSCYQEGSSVHPFQFAEIFHGATQGSTSTGPLSDDRVVNTTIRRGPIGRGTQDAMDQADTSRGGSVTSGAKTPDGVASGGTILM